MPNVPYDSTQVSPYAQNAYRTDDCQIPKYPYESKGESHKQSWQSWVFPTILVLLIVIILLLCSSSGLIAKVLPFFNNTASNESMSKSLAPGINSDDISNWNKAFSWGDHREAGYLTKESDPLYSSSPAAKITEDDLKKIQESYSWGNHATAGYLKSFTETDPKYSSSPASSITASDITKWNSKENAIPTGTTSQYLRGDKTWQTFPTCTGTQALAWNGTSLVCVNFPTYTETDPIFVASPANSITNTMISNWNTAYSWGNHATAGYLTSESDPVFNASPANSITNTMITNWNTAFSWGDHATAGYLTAESDPIFAASPANSITNTMISNWNTAYSWGNHATAGYLTTETDPIFNASPAGSITNTMISNWNTAFSWGDHATAGYLTAESDPIFAASPANSITNTMISDWNTAYSWGNHATAGYLTSEADPVFTASPANSITNTMISNWNTAYSWGNHATAGYLTSETDPVFTASVAASITAADITNWNNKENTITPGTTSQFFRGDKTWQTIPTCTGNNRLTWNGTGFVCVPTGTLTTETDPIFNASPASSITNTMISNWNTAYSWGNHATFGYFNSINGISGPTLTLTVGNTGTDFNLSNAGSSIILNLPDASATARGVVNTADQTFTGTKTFTSAPIFSTMTPGSVLFAGTGGLVSQNNAQLFWDNTNGRLGLGTNIPLEKLHIQNGNVKMTSYGTDPNISAMRWFSSGINPGSFYSLTTTGWGQGFQLSVNAAPTTTDGPGYAYQNMVYMVDPGIYNTGAGVLYFNGNN